MSDNLHILIKSLTKSEKRHFKLFANTFSTKNNYLKLFDEIDAQNVYDESVIKKKFAKEPFTNQLHVTKNYLTKQILKSLGIFSTYHSRESELRNILRNIEILFRRELYHHCKSEIARAEKIAEKFELFTLHIDILGWKRKLILAAGGAIKGFPNLNDLIQKEKELIEKKATLNQYWIHVSQISQVFDGKASWDDIMSSPFVKDIKLAGSARSRILFHHIHYSFNITNQNPTEALIHINKLILLLELNPHRIVEDPSSYIISLNNKIGLLLDLKQHGSIPPLLNKIRTIPEKYNLSKRASSTVRLLIRTYNVELELYRDTKQFEKGKQLIPEVESFIRTNDRLVSPVYRQMLYYQFSYILFKLNDFSDSLKWTNEIINSKFKEERGDILIYARLLNIMIHYELGNIYVLRYAVESARRYLKKQRVFTHFLKKLLKYFSALSTQPIHKHKGVFVKMKSGLFEDVDDREKKNILDYIDFDEWITTKTR